MLSCLTIWPCSFKLTSVTCTGSAPRKLSSSKVQQILIKVETVSKQSSMRVHFAKALHRLTFFHTSQNVFWRLHLHKASKEGALTTSGERKSVPIQSWGRNSAASNWPSVKSSWWLVYVLDEAMANDRYAGMNFGIWHWPQICWLPKMFHAVQGSPFFTTLAGGLTPVLQSKT